MFQLEMADHLRSVEEKKVPSAGGPPVQPIVPGLEGGTNWFPMISFRPLRALGVHGARPS
jgi:hypothetical protein